MDIVKKVYKVNYFVKKYRLPLFSREALCVQGGYLLYSTQQQHEHDFLSSSEVAFFCPFLARGSGKKHE